MLLRNLGGQWVTAPVLVAADQLRGDADVDENPGGGCSEAPSVWKPGNVEGDIKCGMLATSVPGHAAGVLLAWLVEKPKALAAAPSPCHAQHSQPSTLAPLAGPEAVRATVVHRNVVELPGPL